MRARVTLVADAFNPLRSMQVVEVSEHLTIRTFLDGRGIKEFPVPTICLRNGRPLLRRDWAGTVIDHDNIVAFIAQPLGGGGGGGGKNPLTTVLMVAVMVVAMVLGQYYVGPMLASSLGVTSAAGIATVGAISTAAIASVGMMAVGALVSAPSPATPSLNWGGGGGVAPSPTYSLTASGNQARLGQPIPEIFGRHKVVFDLAATPYQEYVAGEQYLFQLHCIGVGQYRLDALMIDDTPLASFEEVQYQVVPPGAAVTLMDAWVVTAVEVAGQELKGPNQLTNGETGWVGPFVANPAATTAHHIGIDVVFTNGLYYANNSGTLDPKTVNWEVWGRRIDDLGAALGDFILLAAETYTAATNTQIRLSYKYAVASARWEVRLRRINDRDQDGRTAHEIRWGEMRSYLEGSPDYGDVTLLAIKMRATDNLSQRSSRLINGIVTRKLPIWSPDTGWSEPVPTQAIAPVAAYIMRAANGAQLADTRQDLDMLWRLHSVWEARGDRFSGVFDTTTTAWEALVKVLRTGRAAPYQQGGIVRYIRDEPRTLPAALFNGRNIVRGSFAIEYVMPGEDTADAVTVEFFDEITWKIAEITAAQRGGAIRVLTPSEMINAPPEKPGRVQMFGITNRDHAGREACFLVACNIYRRRLPTWKTELDGMILSYGELVAVSHPMPAWGQGGELVEWDETAGILTLSEPVRWSDGQAHFMALRRRDGRLDDPVEIEPAPGGDPFQIRALDPLPITPDTGGDRERTYYALGPGTTWAQRVLVRSLRPRSRQVEISGICEDDRVHVN
ncbi:hypothetical protein H261_11074 [Paramagnetospirillum caucaseum]|uniref:Tip attachment protein J HDII-ins2 domain-containing protein n=1 Tax=Paramagnetospirillum caucaseum TaxID=1244869 RepID=M2ZRI3_9PROT|nr:host specificity factor TipJ family phage tail protein [Paramagnetospirillum caucaseum]EME69942.1 hypothetical protein H261_11074 [Paramagnetospirillum caucaseum]